MVCVEKIVELLLPNLLLHFDKPFMFFGCDLGAIIMFEIARKLYRQGKPTPLHLFVCATMAPNIYYFPPIYTLPQKRFLEIIDIFEFPYATKQELTKKLPIIRADFEAMTTYRYKASEPLSCPITAWAAKQDILVSSLTVEAWSKHTTAAF